jgi:hypothetical protein
MANKDYTQRDVIDKLGIKPTHVVACLKDGTHINDALYQRILARTGRPLAELGERVDVVLVVITAAMNAMEVLAYWKPRLKADGGIWLLTPKRKLPGYVDQNELIAAGALAGLVDNKVCSVSDTTSAMRFVIRKVDR